MPVTPVYSLPYQALSDAPDGAGLGEDLAFAVETELARIDGAMPDYLPAANVATAAVSITPVANTPTSGAATWGKTLPGTVRAWCTADSGSPGVVLETSLSAVTATGATVWIYRTTTTQTTVFVVAIGI